MGGRFVPEWVAGMERNTQLPFSTPHIDRDWPVKALMPVDQGN